MAKTFFLTLPVIFFSLPALSIDFFENFQESKVTMPDGSVKHYPNPDVWGFTLWPGIKWPDSYGNGTNYLSNNAECQIYLSPFISKIDGKLIPIQERFDPFEVTNEGLRITAKPLSESQRMLYKSNKYRIFGSGILTSKFNFKYAKINVVAKMSSAKGSWPAIWLLPADHGWPPEIDLIEAMPWGEHKRQVHSGYIATNSEKPSSFGDWYNVNGDISNQFHSYELDWNENNITMKFDDTILWTKPTPASMHKEMYLLINLAVGGKWPYNELKIKPTDSMEEERLVRGTNEISSDYPDKLVIKSIKIINLLE
ncbi:family 16 glycosylhydrolase [Methylobacterium sp. HMF5984]|uniref:glycoside hydrolase family 16 protein n=1 Tax=Methylobacterium sp. HMF5984 TaxID=3367370 RepID=UPI0038552881